jgi:hypothetical protein
MMVTIKKTWSKSEEKPMGDKNSTGDDLVTLSEGSFNKVRYELNIK